MNRRPRLFWVGDAVVQTGFARVTHNVLDYLSQTWDVHVLGINYNGDPHSYKYHIYPAMLGGDVWGVGRAKRLVANLKPDVVLILNDAWCVTPYLAEIEDIVPCVAYIPVDAVNQMAGTRLNTLVRAITYTQFGRKQLMLGGYQGRCDVIPHGVDGRMYHPVPKATARKSVGLAEDAFIVGNVNRNQPRKRLDLTIQAWTQWWVSAGQPRKALLYLHASNNDIGINILQLCRYYGIEQQLVLTNPKMTTTHCLEEKNMKLVYNCFDVQINTGVGEGWGLTNHEGMACGVPQIAVDTAGLAEWAAGAAMFVPVVSHQATMNGINTIAGVPSVDDLAKAIGVMYERPDIRASYARKAYERAMEPRFSWEVIAKQFDFALYDVVTEVRKSTEEAAKAEEAQRGQVPA